MADTDIDTKIAKITELKNKLVAETRIKNLDRDKIIDLAAKAYKAAGEDVPSLIEFVRSDDENRAYSLMFSRPKSYVTRVFSRPNIRRQWADQIQEQYGSPGFIKLGTAIELATSAVCEAVRSMNLSYSFEFICTRQRLFRGYVELTEAFGLPLEERGDRELSNLIEHSWLYIIGKRGKLIFFEPMRGNK